MKNNASAATIWPQEAKIFLRSKVTGAEGVCLAERRQSKKLSRFLAVATVFGEFVAERADADLQ
jgi:hypothetical protein